MALINITDELESKRRYGVPWTGVWRTQWPIVADIGPIRCMSEREARDGVLYPYAPADIEADIEANLPQLPRLDAETDHDLVRMMREHPFGRPKTYAEYRRAIEFFAMPVGSLDPSPERDAAASCTHAVFPWGEGRDQFRKGIEEAKARAEKERAEAEEAARLAAIPNKKTLRELGYVGVLLPTGTAPASWPRWVSAVEMFEPSAELRKGALRHPEGDVLLFRPRFGVDFGEEHIAGTPCRFVSSFAPKAVPMVKARPLPFAVLSTRNCEEAPVTMSRDGRTAEGEKAEADFVALVKTHMGAIDPRHGNAEFAKWSPKNDEHVKWGRWAVQAGRRGFGLRRELVFHNMRKLFPPSTWSDARLEKLLDQAEKGTPEPWFSPDELYTPPSPSFAQRFLSTFGEERKWRAVLATLTEGKDFVLKAECQEAILAAGLASKFTNDEHETVLRVMTALGFKDGRKSIDGETKRGFIRGTP